MTEFDPSVEYARSLDAADPLGRFRKKFSIPEDRDGRSCVYACGNSLGLRPNSARNLVNEVLDDWARLGVEGHFKAARPWLNYHQFATAGLAMLVGAGENEVVAMNTLTVNLHIMMASFYRPDGRRNKIVIESGAFPSDYFAVTSQIQLHGFDPASCLVEWEPRKDGLLYDEDLAALLDEHEGQVALLLLPGVQYYTGQVLDMAALCRLARNAGCKIGLDLAHAVGNVPMQLHEWGPDFAAWCNYKYLNSGPGSVAGAFVHSRHLDGDGSGQLTGWWGHEEATRFKMARAFRPAPGIERWQLSNPPVLALAPVIASLGLFAEAGLSALVDKSRLQTSYLRYLIDRHFAGRVAILTPMHARGCQLSLVITDSSLDARAVFEKLAGLNVIGDWREPDVIRVAPVPLYNSFEDVHELVERLIMATENDEKK